MPLVLSPNKALLSLQPLAEEVEANKPPVINTYTPEVEKWRRQVWDEMPPQIRARPDSATLLDKALYVIEGESGGRDTAVGDGGAAWGLAQSHHIPAGSDASTQIRDMWRLVANNPDQWTDWGEGTLYEGKVFGALGNKPYNGQTGGMLAQSINQTIGNRPMMGNPAQQSAISTYQDAYNQNDNPLARSALSKALQNVGSPVDPATGGVWDGDYRITQPQEQSPYVDPSAQGTLRGELQARREGEDELGQAAKAAAVALPMIGVGPVATAIGAVGSEVGAGVDERLGLPKLNLPVLGQAGPFELAGGALGGSKAENALAPTPAIGRPWANVVPPPKPNLRLVQPGETPYGVKSIAGKPDPQDFIKKAREMGLSDDEIRSSFPGALEAASGIDTAPQIAARTELEQAAKGGAARRVYNRMYQQHFDDLIAEGYSEAEAKQIATGLSTREARRAAAQAPEGLPEQKPNVPYSEDTAEAMRQAGQRNRPGVMPEGESQLPVLPGSLAETNPDMLRPRPVSTEPKIPSLSDVGIQAAADIARISADPYGEAIRFIRGKGKSKLQQAVEDEQQEKGKRRTPEENAALRAARTANPSNEPSLQRALEQDAERARFTAPSDNPEAGQLGLGLQGGQVGLSDAGDIPPSVRPPAGATLGQQRLNRGLQTDLGPAGTGTAVEGQVPKGSEAPQTALPGIPNNVQKGVSFAGDVLNEINALAGKSLSLKSSLSPPLLRQGLPRLLTNPRAAVKEMGLSLKGAVDEETGRLIDDASFRAQWINPYSKDGVSPYKGFTADEVGLNRWDWGEQASADSRVPDYEGRGKSKILTAAGKKVGEAQEAIAGPGRKLGTGEGTSERQTALQMNLNARGRYQETAQRLWDWEDAAGIEHNKKAYEELASVINHSMQRGGWKQGGFPLLFSTQALSGRIKALYDSTVGIAKNPADLLKPGATQEAGKNLLAFMALNYTLAELASQIPGVEVNFNPLPEIRIGEHHYDMWGGFKPVVRYAADLGKIVYKTVQTGDIDKGVKDAGTRTSDFLQAGLSPVTSKLVSASITGKDFIGKPYSITEDITSGKFFRDLGLNFFVDSIWDAFEADGLKGVAMDAPLGFFSGGVNTYNSPKDRRNDAAQEIFGKQFDDLTPVQRAEVDKRPEVAQAVTENPSDYRTNKEAVIGPIEQKQAGYEQAFKANKLDKPLPEYWADLGNERRGAMSALSNQFKDMFEGFDKSRYDNAVGAYYELANSPQSKNPDGSIDYDALEATRQDFIKTLKPDEQQWLDEALQVSRESKSPAHQKYLKYIDERKAAGYFDVKVDDPDRAKKLVELDRKNPLQDALNWYWKGGLLDPESPRIPALNSPEGIAYALQMAPDRPVKYAGLGRPLNQSPGALQAWQDYQSRIQNYYTKTVPAYQDQIAQDMFGVKYAQLPDRASRERVASNILTQVRRGSPELEAILQYLGDTADPNGDYVVSAEAGQHLSRMIAKYGPQPVKSVNASGRPSKFLVRD